MTAYKQLHSGLMIDLIALDLAEIDIERDIALPLAGQARWDAQLKAGYRGNLFSVAQHCVMGADALLDEVGDATTALAFLMHDAHEALIGDQTTPTVQALEHFAEVALAAAFGACAAQRARDALGGGFMRTVVAGLKNAVDRHLFRLAGLPHPLPPAIERAVKEMDARMLDAERRQLMNPCKGDPRRYYPEAVLKARPVRVHGGLKPWSRGKAATEWLSRFEQWRRPIAPARAPTDAMVKAGAREFARGNGFNQVISAAMAAAPIGAEVK